MTRQLQKMILACVALFSISPGFATEVAPYFNIENPPAAGSFNPWPTSGLMDAHIKAGLINAMITFGDLGQGDCPDIRVAQKSAVDDIKAFVATGGDVIISISGATCGNTGGRDLTTALSEMMDQTGTRKIDFDVEDTYVKSPGDTQRRIQAIQELKKKYPDLFVSFTFGAVPLVDYNTDPSQAGLPTGEQIVVKTTLASGVKIDRVTVMPFAWDFSKETFKKYPFYVLTEMTVESLADQMQELFSVGQSQKLSRDKVYSMIGVLPMIGMGDTVPFYQKDAELVGEYAREKGLAVVSYYVFQRDQSQTTYGIPGDDYLNFYSGVPQKDFEFFHCFEGIDCK